MTSDGLARLEASLWPQGEKRDIWMIVDAARDRRIFSMLLECHLNYSCLYSGPIPPAVEIAAPYLVQLDYDYPDTRRFLTQASGENWGVFLRCDASLESLRRHLRGFLVVRDARGKRLVFRYYDPRVLRVYLPTCNRQELDTVYGPVQRFWTDSMDADEMLQFDFTGDRIMTTHIRLDAETPEVDPNVKAPERPERPRRIPLVIRRTQMDAFNTEETRKFEDWMIDHLRRCFPRQSAASGETGMRRTVQRGVRQATTYGISSRRDVCKFIDLVIVFGAEFEANGKLPMAIEILQRPVDGEMKMQSLMQHARHVLGAR